MSWLSKSALTQNNKLFNIGSNFIIFFSPVSCLSPSSAVDFFKVSLVSREKGGGEEGEAACPWTRIYDSLCQSNPTSEGNKEICISKPRITTPRLFISYLWAGLLWSVYQPVRRSGREPPPKPHSASDLRGVLSGRLPGSQAQATRK